MGVKIIEKSASAYTYPLLIKNILTAPLRYAPEQEIVYRDSHRYTYREFAKRVARLAHALGDIGICAGDTVAVLDWDSHRYLECYFAVPMMGAILHTLNFRLSPEQLAYTINHAEDDVIIVHQDFLPVFEQIRPLLGREIKVVSIAEGEQEFQLPEAVGEYEELLSWKSDDYIFPDFDENAAATIFYTTGTTGRPKGVSFSHRQIVLHTYGFISGLCAFESFVSVNSGDVYLPLTPMFHVHAWGMPYLFTMLGAKQVYPGRYEPAKILELVAREGATFSHCVPTIMHMILSDPSAEVTDLSGWKVVIGGSALSQGLCVEAEKRGINLFAAYGMSETCPLLTIAIPKAHMLQQEGDLTIIRCRTGLPVPMVDMEIVDPDGKPLVRDGKQKGEVVVRSPWLAQAYVKDPEKSEELWRDGWLHTGDVGVIDPEGYLQITDRIKDVIKTGGEWISSLELEDLISRHEAVSEAAVIGVPHEKWGERPVTLVVLKQGFGRAVTEEELKELYEESAESGLIPKYGIPDRVLIVSSIAKTSVGKLNKKALRETYRTALSN
ncbi:fatty acid--CoA ligase [Desulfopila aestuarii]|uniref:Fatty-acyl-CoA synthase n=1 Tax=Desulfopila aestuarii DSM 18488 TaxID=1121416 RepID=A0A1M7YFX6_9BACT|nr:fatty acid--CoA ligase [Desulfopila aestuarii]SHO51545.1 fatty-acyl-CoA synthase [Desulfopila aestuarii DSM 18488]